MEIKVSFIAKQLGKSIDVLSDKVKKQITTAIKQLSLNTYSEAQRLANQKLKSSREDYINSLKYQEVPNKNIYIIYLDEKGVGKYFEKGWNKFDMVPGLVNGPKSRISEEGIRYNIVPFRKKSTAPEGSSVNVVDTASMIQKIIKDNSIEKIEKEVLGGKITTYKGISDPTLKGLTRVSQKYKTKEGKERISSQYYIFRVVTQNSKGWKNPGFRGAHIFKELESYVELNIRNILKEIL